MSSNYTFLCVCVSIKGWGVGLGVVDSCCNHLEHLFVICRISPFEGKLPAHCFIPLVCSRDFLLKANKNQDKELLSFRV